MMDGDDLQQMRFCEIGQLGVDAEDELEGVAVRLLDIADVNCQVEVEKAEGRFVEAKIEGLNFTGR